MNKKRKQKVITTINGPFGVPVVEYYESKHRGKDVVRFRVVAANGEIIPHPYSNISNAKRGTRDLFEALQKIYDPKNAPGA